MPDDAHAWIGVEHSLQPLRRIWAAVGYDHHPGVDRVADPDAAAMMN